MKTNDTKIAHLQICIPYTPYIPYFLTYAAHGCSLGSTYTGISWLLEMIIKSNRDENPLVIIETISTPLKHTLTLRS